MSGGTSLTTFSPALRTRSPASRQASTIGAAGVESSTPMRRPRPRTCLTTGHAGCSARRPSISSRPIRAARSGSLSPITVVSVARATCVTNGVPPKVEPCEPAVSTDAASSRQSMAPMGTPLASAFASVITSGSTPACS